MPDPTMPRQMPAAVERALREMMGWRNRPSPIDLYMAIRDTLKEAQAGGEGPRFSMESITSLAASIADWCPHPSIRIFLFGSRVRGDHRDDSDVDVAIEITDYTDEPALDWWGRQDVAEFREDVPEDLPGPLHVLRADDDEEQEVWAKIVDAEHVHVDRNVTCVILPSTPPEVRAAQKAAPIRRPNPRG